MEERSGLDSIPGISSGVERSSLDVLTTYGEKAVSGDTGHHTFTETIYKNIAIH